MIRPPRAIPGLLAVTLLLSGCDTPGRNPFGGNDRTADAPPSQQDISRTISRVTGTDNGLAIRKWVVEDDEARIRNVLMSHAVGGVLHDAADERLQRNGFRLVRVPAADVDSILAELGGATMDVTAWHGEVYEWRTLAAHAIGRDGQPIAIDGRVRRFPPGEMRLVMRSWIVGMEDGPRVQFELVPQFYLPRKRDLNILVGREKPQPVESYPSMAVDELLEDDAAYVLTCAPPQSDWQEPASERPTGAAGEEGAATPNRSARRSGGMGPDAMLGPDAAPPQTIGQWMFSNDIGRPSRIMLILLPRIADRLQPQEITDAGTVSER